MASDPRLGVAALVLVGGLLTAGCVGPSGNGNAPPIAKFSASKEVVAINEPVLFDGNQSYDPDGVVALYQWNFGDGTPQETGAIVGHRYGAAGRFTVTLTVTDSKNAQNARAANITVNDPPKATLTVSPGPYFAKEPITLSATQSRDPDGRIAAYAWDLGDGEAASTEAVQHSYVTTGTFTARLTVFDNNGATDNATATFFVDLHTYDVSFSEHTQDTMPIRNFTLQNQTKTVTIEIFLENLTQVNFTLTWRDPMPVQGPPNDVIELQITSPDGPSMRATGAWDNITLSFNLNAIPSPVQVRAASAADVPGVLGDAYLGRKGVGVWIVEITAVSLGGGFVQDQGFVPEPLFVWMLTTSLTTYEAVPTQIG